MPEDIIYRIWRLSLV